MPKGGVGCQHPLEIKISLHREIHYYRKTLCMHLSKRIEGTDRG